MARHRIASTTDWSALEKPENPKVDAAEWQTVRERILYLHGTHQISMNEINDRMGYRGQSVWNLLRGRSLPREDARRRLDALYEYYLTGGKKSEIPRKRYRRRAPYRARKVQPEKLVVKSARNGNGKHKPSLLSALANMEKELDQIHSLVADVDSRIRRLKEGLAA